MKYNIELELKLVTEQIIEDIQDYLEDHDIDFKVVCNEVNEKEIELIEDFLIENGINYKANVIDKKEEDEESYLSDKLEENKRYYNDRN